MIERELARLRFLNTLTIKNDPGITSEDIDFIERKHNEIKQILDGIEETLDILKQREENS